MRTNIRWRGPWTGVLALAIVALLPELVSAQANALFPDIYIKRKRPCVDQENPQNRMIRESFYGYYPTCWRRFPEGWGCISPDKPDWAAALKALPLEVGAAEDNGGGTDTRPDPFNPGNLRQGGNQPSMPELPEDGGTLFPDGTTKPPAGGEATPTTPPDPSAPRPEGFDPFRDRAATASPTPAGAPEPRSTANLRLDSDEPPPLAPPAASLPRTGPEALPPGDTTPAIGPVGSTTNSPRRGFLAQWFGRTRRPPSYR